MKKIIISIAMLIILCAYHARAQEKTIRSKYGMAIYPAISKINTITVYPNPTASSIRFKSKEPLAGFDLEVIDQNGVSYLKREGWRNEVLDVSHLKSGIYIVCFTKGREKYAQKLLIQREAP